ncbi:MAG: PHB depolymerase family esterase [Sphingomonas bacterium]|nr:PHB depolymerase family esterase [Sphingomonas bacterium]
MRRLGPTVARLHSMRKASTAAMAKLDSFGVTPSRLDTMTGFGANPGALVAKTYLPQTLAADAPLVVVLHGCTQNAALYDRGSGWSELADRHGFALLFPEQTRANNHNLCFNWYASSDVRRGQGEVASIAHMVRHMVAAHDLDPARVFITGLSAGGAMTTAMLASYPDLFSGGAVIAGLPFGVAEGVPQALERMRGQGFPSRGALASKIANAADHDGPWPTLSVWHGSADTLVVPANADVIVDQWRDRVGLVSVEGEVDEVDGHPRTIWRDSKGRVLIERYDIAGMGHGTPLATRGEESCGTAGAHMLEAGICSTSRIAGSWGLTGKTVRQAAPRADAVRSPTTPALKPAVKPRARSTPAAPRAKGVGAVIEDALRAAGLMR